MLIAKYPLLNDCFYYCYVHIRALHSFPTRRSSDLCQGSTSYLHRRSSARRHCPRSTRPCTRASSNATSQDRKSTRLNSSHVEISYAVFCLKKKTRGRWHEIFRIPDLFYDYTGCM